MGGSAGRRGAALMAAGAAALFGSLSEAGAVNFTIAHRTPLDLTGAQLVGLEPAPFDLGLVLSTAPEGILTSREIFPPSPFEDLVVSWNADLTKGSRLEAEAQARVDGKWTAWFRLGVAEPEGGSSPERQEDAAGWVDADTLKLKRPAEAFRYRIRLKAGKRPAVLRLAAVTVASGPGPEAPPAFAAGPWVRELALRPRSQMEEAERFRHDICSPTALAMVLEHWGVRKPTVDVALQVQDRVSGIFGNWPFNVAAASGWGLEGFVARLESLSDLELEIAAGRPVVVSISFGPGELSGAPIKKTRGHLLVVAGFTPDGHVICLDPASPERRGARRVYDRAQFHKAWRLNKKGLAYLLSKPFAREFSVGAPATELRRKPRPGDGRAADKDRLSQLLYGERVRVLGVDGPWARVEALDQESFLPAKRWQGYPGWVSAQDLAYGPAPAPNAFVKESRAFLQSPPQPLTVPLGARLREEARQGDLSLVRLHDGRPAMALSALLQRPAAKISPAAARAEVLRIAGLLMDAPYVWGGRTSTGTAAVSGVDCSGLVNLAYQSAGIAVPRDAHEQMLRSKRVGPLELEPGDLVFLTDSPTSGTATHVMIFAGGEELIEARGSAGRVLRATFRERFGTPRAVSGRHGWVTDLTAAKPVKRGIVFGSFISQPPR